MLGFLGVLGRHKAFSLAFFVVLLIFAFAQSAEVIGVELLLNIVYAVTEAVVICCFGIFASTSRRGFVRLLWWAIFLVASIVYLIQIYSLHQTGGYISALALANAQTAYTTNVAYNALYLVILFFLALQVFEWLIRGNSTETGVVALLAVMGIGSLIYMTWGRGVPESNNMIIKVGESPVRSLVNSARDMHQGVQKLDHGELKHVIDRLNKPVRVNTNYEGVIGKGNNIIVVFTEGFSARWSSFYGGKNAGLMPNF